MLDQGTVRVPTTAPACRLWTPERRHVLPRSRARRGHVALAVRVRIRRAVHAPPHRASTQRDRSRRLLPPAPENCRELPHWVQPPSYSCSYRQERARCILRSARLDLRASYQKHLSETQGRSKHPEHAAREDEQCAERPRKETRLHPKHQRELLDQA